MSQSPPRNDQINCWTKASANLVVNLIFAGVKLLRGGVREEHVLKVIGFRGSSGAAVISEFCLSL